MIVLVRSASHIQRAGLGPERGAPVGAQQQGMEAVPEVRADSPATAVRLVVMPNNFKIKINTSAKTGSGIEVELLARSVI